MKVVSKSKTPPMMPGASKKTVKIPTIKDPMLAFRKSKPNKKGTK